MFAEGQLGWSYEIDNRLSDFIKLYRLPCHWCELILVVSDDKRVIEKGSSEDYLIYFRTKNYVENILDRYIEMYPEGYYVGVSNGPTPLEQKNKLKLKDLVKNKNHHQ